MGFARGWCHREPVEDPRGHPSILTQLFSILPQAPVRGSRGCQWCLEQWGSPQALPTRPPSRENCARVHKSNLRSFNSPVGGLKYFISQLLCNFILNHGASLTFLILFFPSTLPRSPSYWSWGELAAVQTHQNPRGLSTGVDPRVLAPEGLPPPPCLAWVPIVLSKVGPAEGKSCQHLCALSCCGRGCSPITCVTLNKLQMGHPPPWTPS